MRRAQDVGVGYRRLTQSELARSRSRAIELCVRLAGVVARLLEVACGDDPVVVQIGCARERCVGSNPGGERLRHVRGRLRGVS